MSAFIWAEAGIRASVAHTPSVFHVCEISPWLPIYVFRPTNRLSDIDRPSKVALIFVVISVIGAHLHSSELRVACILYLQYLAVVTYIYNTIHWCFDWPFMAIGHLADGAWPQKFVLAYLIISVETVVPLPFLQHFGILCNIYIYSAVWSRAEGASGWMWLHQFSTLPIFFYLCRRGCQNWTYWIFYSHDSAK